MRQSGGRGLYSQGRSGPAKDPKPRTRSLLDGLLLGRAEIETPHCGPHG